MHFRERELPTTCTFVGSSWWMVWALTPVERVKGHLEQRTQPSSPSTLTEGRPKAFQGPSLRDQSQGVHWEGQGCGGLLGQGDPERKPLLREQRKRRSSAWALRLKPHVYSRHEKVGMHQREPNTAAQALDPRGWGRRGWPERRAPT